MKIELDYAIEYRLILMQKYWLTMTIICLCIKMTLDAWLNYHCAYSCIYIKIAYNHDLMRHPVVIGIFAQTI